MARKKKSAYEFLVERYVGDDPERLADLEQERLNAEVAREVYDARKRAGLSQKQLAERVGTTQSVISRLEDADYGGHSVKMLSRIARALGQRLKIAIEDDSLVANHVSVE